MKKLKNIRLLPILVVFTSLVVAFFVISKALALNDHDKWAYTETTSDFTVSFATTKTDAKVKFVKDGYEVIYEEPLNNPDLRKNGNSYIFTDTGNGTRLIYHVTENGLKEDIVFEKAPDSNVLRVKIRTSGVVMSLNEDSTPVFKDMAGNYKFHLEAPWMKDSSGNDNRDLYYTVSSTSGNNYTLDLNLDHTWLADSQRTYPVIVDPIMFFRGINFRKVNVSKSFYCGSPITVDHVTTGGVAPENKTVTYGTVLTDIAGTDSKCWITKNLGATDQAQTVTDGDEPSAGWYWQFNRKQGFKYDSSRTPNDAWISSINESADWQPANDPCTLELGVGWRVPTYTEWFNADSNQGWGDNAAAFGSLLNIHGAGYLDDGTGALTRGTGAGRYWSSTAQSATNGYWFNISNIASSMTYNWKAFGLSVRCVRDMPTLWACGDVLTKSHTTTNAVAPVDKVVHYGTVWSTLGGTGNKCWITKNLGATTQAGSATDNTEASAGWYWRFNRKQGYKHTGSVLTPAWPGDSISEDSDWVVDNDPCALELGVGWRVPNYTEWFNADSNGGWVDYDNDATGSYGSVLKIHAAGYISSGALGFRGSNGWYWSSTQSTTGNSNQYNNYSNSSGMGVSAKNYGFPLRCIKD